MHDPQRDVIDRILDTAKVFAMVGASPNPDRPSYRVMGVLTAHGYTVQPVAPRAQLIRGVPAYRRLADVPGPLDVVEVFRRSDRAGEVVDEAIALGAKAVWLQLDVVDTQAAARAQAAGLDVVMDRCPAIELRRRAGET